MAGAVCWIRLIDTNDCGTDDELSSDSDARRCWTSVAAAKTVKNGNNRRRGRSVHTWSL